MTPPLTEQQFRALVAQFVQEQGTQTKAAKAIGISTQFMCDYLGKRRGAGQKLAAYFGLVPQVVYGEKGNKE